jgi:hypothetical protein
MRTFKFLITAALPFILAACNLPAPKEKEGGKSASLANFYMAGQVQGSVIAEDIGGEFDLPVNKTYKFYACFRYQNYRDDVAGARFNIKEISTEVRSNDSGCITWAEKLPYNFLGDSNYVEIERTVEGKGLLKGSVKVRMAINPWSHGEKLADVIDLNNSNNTSAELKSLITDNTAVSEALNARAFSAGKRARRLWVEDGRFFSMEKQFENGKLNLEVETRVTPQLKLSKMNGDPVMRPLTKGHFRSTLALIHMIVKDGKEQRVILDESKPVESQVINGTLSIKAPLSLVRVPSRGQIYVALKVAPAQSAAGIQPFEGVYYVGEYDALKTSAFLKLATQAAEDESFTIKKFASADIQTVLSSKSSEDQESYLVPKITFRELQFSRLDAVKETTAHRTIRFGIRACLANGVDQKIVRAHKFIVNKFRQSDKEAPSQTLVDTVDNSSCLYFEDFITMDYFGCQRYFPGFIDLINKDLGVNERIQVLLNPWESWRIMGRDMRYVQNNEHLPVTCDTRQGATIQIEKYSYEQNNVSYEMDDQLNLTKVMNVQFNSRPVVKNMSNLYNGWDQTDSLRDGLYLLKFAILRNKAYSAGETQVLHLIKQIMPVSAGTLMGFTQYKIKDLMEIGNTNTVLMQILPVKAELMMNKGNNFVPKSPVRSLEDVVETDTDLRSPVFTGVIKLSKEAEGFDLRPLNMSDVSAYYMNDSDHSVKSNKDATGVDWFKNLETLQAQQKAASVRAVAVRAAPETLAREANLKLVHMNSVMETTSLRRALGTLVMPFKFGIAPAPNLSVYESAKAAASYDDLSSLRKAMDKGSFDASTAARMCFFWFQDFMQNEKIGGKPLLNDNAHVDMARDCYSAATKNPAKFFQVEKHTIVKKSRLVDFVRGVPTKYSIGSSFSISNSHSDSFSRNLGISASAKAFDFFNVGASASYGLSWSTSDALGLSNSVSVGSSNSLEIERTSFRVLLDKYEQCLVVRLNPNLFITNTNQHLLMRDKNYSTKINSELTPEQQSVAKTRGLLLCDGQDSTKTLLKTENYYFIDGDEVKTIGDHGDIRNRPFVMQLRGDKDFRRFEVGAKLLQQNPDTAEGNSNIPTNQLDQAIKMFDLGLPTYPAHLTH